MHRYYEITVDGDTAKLHGLRNAAYCAKLALKAMGFTVDEESFDRVASLRGDAPPEALEKGFIVQSYDDIQRLCEIADMAIYQDGDTIKAIAVSQEGSC